jgi:putative ABC transport system permease protein
MNILKLAYKNIIDNPLNLLLSIILFALGIGLISFLLLLNTQLKEKFDSNLAGIDMVIGAKGSPLQLILCSMYHIDSPTGNITIQEATPFLRAGHPLIETSVPLSLGDSYGGYRIVGTDHSILELYNVEIEEGQLYFESMEVTVGKAVALEKGLKIGDTFYSSHGFNEGDFEHDEVSFKVVGIFAGSGTVIDQLILTPSSSIWATHDHDHEGEEGHEQEGEEEHDHDHEGEEGHDHDHDHHEGHVHTIDRSDLLSYPEKEITSILVKFKNNKNFQALNMPRNINENTDLQAAAPAYEINRLYAMIGTGTNAIRSLAILIAIVSALSIFIFLFKSLKERRYELALMRVMGGGKTKLFSLIVLEGLILSIIGYLIGILLSHVAMEVMAYYLQSDYRYSFTGFRWLSEEWLLLLLSLGIGFVAAVIPAWRASNTDINKILSRNGG